VKGASPERAEKTGGGKGASPERAEKNGGGKGASPGLMAGKNGGEGGGPEGKCLASNREALSRSPSVPAWESMLRSLTYLPCEEAAEAAVGMEAMMKEEKMRSERGERKSKRETNEGAEIATDIQKHALKHGCKKVCRA
jgi:hypothetical protein